ncbi:tyrosine-protein phosphatase [Comamonas flocculans]|uniref:Tyrosine-protein phosphatase n=1 Tax=Comamonas flocculans TaxID=2597701 RepID=A0A5B8RW46_9BURK|nr:tyrosine-protein phosphatase [Comamonas flocculans]QEA12445.1 tyrosine-protein phosphatase [Comamonas flocculans]
MTETDRALALQGASNFRDLGGYAAADGRRVRWRRLFRSDHLAALTSEDAQALAALGLARAVDFRGQAERAQHAYALPGVAQLALPIEPTVVRRFRELSARGELLDASHAERLMHDTYLGFVADDAPQLRAFFGQLLEDGAPLVFHCTAGKDRTGYAAALLLLALGVPRETVMHDYLLTNRLYRRPPAPADDARTRAVHAVIWGVHAGYLQTALDAIEREHGGVQTYLRERLGLSEAARQQLARLYLQPPAR